MADTTDRTVVVVTRYGSTTSHWSEWPGKTFAEVTEAIAERAKDKKASGKPSEILEVQVVRRAVVKADITVEEVPVGPEADDEITGDECRVCGISHPDSLRHQTRCTYTAGNLPAPRCKLPINHSDGHLFDTIHAPGGMR